MECQSLEQSQVIAAPHKEMGGLCPTKAQTPQRLSAKHFERPGEGFEVGCCKLLGAGTSFVHEVQLTVFL